MNQPERQSHTETGADTSAAQATTGPVRRVKTGKALQGSLFASLPEPLLDELRQTDLAALSPEATAQLLKRLKDLAG